RDVGSSECLRVVGDATRHGEAEECCFEPDPANRDRDVGGQREAAKARRHWLRGRRKEPNAAPEQCSAGSSGWTSRGRAHEASLAGVTAGAVRLRGQETSANARRASEPLAATMKRPFSGWSAAIQ